MLKNIDLLRILLLLLVALAGIVFLGNNQLSLYNNSPGYVTGTSLSNIVFFALILASLLLNYLIMKYEQLEKVAELNNTIKTQRHDFAQHVQVIYSLIKLECYVEAMEYIEKYFKEISIITELNKLENKEIAVLLLSKQARAQNNGIDFELDIDTRLKSIPISVIQFNSMIGNLIDNALDATLNYDGTKLIKIKIKELVDSFAVSVSNTGYELQRDNIKKMFAPGFTNKKGKHMGLGLSSVNKIVKQHGGKIEVISKNNQTTFMVTLPKLGE
jgi:sensor histidine kinase regulating citrate/malate metabolism